MLRTTGTLYKFAAYHCKPIQICCVPLKSYLNLLRTRKDFRRLPLSTCCQSLETLKVSVFAAVSMLFYVHSPLSALRASAAKVENCHCHRGKRGTKKNPVCTKSTVVSQVTLFKEIASASQTPATEREEFGKRLCSQRKKREKLRRWALSGPGR